MLNTRQMANKQHKVEIGFKIIITDLTPRGGWWFVRDFNYPMENYSSRFRSLSRQFQAEGS